MSVSRVPAHRVSLLLFAPDAGPVRSEDVEALLQALAAPGDPAAVPRVSARVRSRAVVVLEVVHEGAPGERAAARAVVDQVRASLGLSATFARWVVDARHVRVRALESDT